MCWISAKGFLSSSFSYLSLTSSLTLQCGNLNLSQPIKASDNPISLCTFRDSSSCSILGPVTCNWRTHKHKFNLVRFYTAPEYHLPQGSDHNPPFKKKLSDPSWMRFYFTLSIKSPLIFLAQNPYLKPYGTIRIFLMTLLNSMFSILALLLEISWKDWIFKYPENLVSSKHLPDI